MASRRILPGEQWLYSTHRRRLAIAHSGLGERPAPLFDSEVGLPSEVGHQRLESLDGPFGDLAHRLGVAVAGRGPASDPHPQRPLGDFVLGGVGSLGQAGSPPAPGDGGALFVGEVLRHVVKIVTGPASQIGSVAM